MGSSGGSSDYFMCQLSSNDSGSAPAPIPRQLEEWERGLRRWSRKKAQARGHRRGGSGGKRVMVVVDQSSGAKHAMMWALTHVANRGGGVPHAAPRPVARQRRPWEGRPRAPTKSPPLCQNLPTLLDNPKQLPSLMIQKSQTLEQSTLSAPKKCFQRAISNPKKSLAGSIIFVLMG
ncbi:hypothetical protein ZWY2020_044539 [Hordeum vulgare]|nr:hypothetical protein ZWY2020_044539 [Hordeum vulgare]